MSLYIVATPLGDQNDLSERAILTLRAAHAIIGEEGKPTRAWMKMAGATGKEIYLLNEHSSPQDLKTLVNLCREKEMALVSDCGTPGFCDPGAELVQACRREGVKVRSVPGPCSLAAFLSVSGRTINEFLFKGFLSNKSEIRDKQILALKTYKIPVILMDTPYRLTRLLADLNSVVPSARVTIGLDLSCENEEVVEGRPQALIEKLQGQKREFVLMVESSASH